jgi:hypothetical protein
LAEGFEFEEIGASLHGLEERLAASGSHHQHKTETQWKL